MKNSFLILFHFRKQTAAASPDIIISTRERRIMRITKMAVLDSGGSTSTAAVVVDVVVVATEVVVVLVVVDVDTVVVEVVVTHSGLIKSPRSLLQLINTEDPSL